jgi:hypothetical protein
MPPAFLDLIFPQHQLPNGNNSQHPRRCDKPTHTIQKKTRKKHRKRKSEALKNRPQTDQTTQTNLTPIRTSTQRPKWQLKRTHTNPSTTLTAPPLGPSQPTYQPKCERQKGAVKRGQNKNPPKPRNVDLKHTQAKPKKRHKNNLPKKDTKHDTNEKDLYRQLETLVQDHIETQLKHRHNGQLPYKRFSRRPSNTDLHILERHKRRIFGLIQTHVEKYIGLSTYTKNDHSTTLMCNRLRYDTLSEDQVG